LNWIEARGVAKMAAMNLTALHTAGQGFGLSLGLIVAIGAQNAFVLRQGLRRQHVGAVVAFCALADALLVAVGVFSSAWLAQRLPGLAPALTLAGASFLIVYGALALRRALRGPAALQPAGEALGSRASALAQALAFTLLNPHVYLDTLLLMGSVGAQQPAALQPAFVLGAGAASVVWFCALGLTAVRLAPWLARPAVWRGIDSVMGLMLIGLGLALLAKLA
jgi:L-lysine exporter family protein LysE/ArgO